jgi:hypothetical protein
MLNVIEFLSVIAAAFALYHKVQEGRSRKRLLRLLKEKHGIAGNWPELESSDKEDKAG